MKEVLVVDDSQASRKVARRLLEGLHLRASEAADGRSALSECDKRMPDAILLDCHMPEMDGFEVLSALRKMPGGRAPKVIVCLSERDIGAIARAKHAGADDFMLKPFSRAVLLAKCEEIGLV